MKLMQDNEFDLAIVDPPYGINVANNSTGVVSIDDNGGSITVDGTVTANLSATDNTVLDNIQTSVDTIAAAVSTEMQVDVVGALPAGTNAIGKLAANSGVDIGDVDILSIAAGSNLVGDVGLSGARTSGGTTLYKNIDVDESEDQVKGTAGQVYWIHAVNLKATPLYLKFYNATAASVTVGTKSDGRTLLTRPSMAAGYDGSRARGTLWNSCGAGSTSRTSVPTTVQPFSVKYRSALLPAGPPTPVIITTSFIKTLS